jgi:hypothetical protein
MIGPTSCGPNLLEEIYIQTILTNECLINYLVLELPEEHFKITESHEKRTEFFVKQNFPYHLHLRSSPSYLSPHLQINTHNHFSFLFSISKSFQRLWKQSSQSPEAQSLRIRVPIELLPIKSKNT